MGIGVLPTSLSIADKDYPIRTDYRDILRIFEACEDPELSDGEKALVMLTVLYPDFKTMDVDLYEEALKQARWFIDYGQKEDEAKPSNKVIDWEQDEGILFPAINQVAGMEVRSVKYIHWWTFMGYFMEIREGTFSAVLSIRQKRAKGKHLEKWEQDFYRNNKKLCDLRKRYTPEEQEEIDYWNKLLG